MVETVTEINVNNIVYNNLYEKVSKNLTPYVQKILQLKGAVIYGGFIQRAILDELFQGDIDITFINITYDELIDNLKQIEKILSELYHLNYVRGKIITFTSMCDTKLQFNCNLYRSYEDLLMRIDIGAAALIYSMHTKTIFTHKEINKGLKMGISYNQKFISPIRVKKYENYGYVMEERQFATDHDFDSNYKCVNIFIDEIATNLISYIERKNDYFNKKFYLIFDSIDDLLTKSEFPILGPKIRTKIKGSTTMSEIRHVIGYMRSCDIHFVYDGSKELDLVIYNALWNYINDQKILIPFSFTQLYDK